jgi:hypothetical protein
VIEIRGKVEFRMSAFLVCSQMLKKRAEIRPNGHFIKHAGGHLAVPQP